MKFFTLFLVLASLNVFAEGEVVQSANEIKIDPTVETCSGDKNNNGICDTREEKEAASRRERQPGKAKAGVSN